MCAGAGLRDRRGDVLAAAADAVHVLAADGPGAAGRRGWLPAAELHRDGQRLAGHLERPRPLPTARGPQALLLDYPLRLLRLSCPPQLQQLGPRARRLHRRRGGGRQVRRLPLPLPPALLQGQ